MDGNIFAQLASGSDPLIGVLSFSIIALASVVVVQWRYMTKNTVPKWAWDSRTNQLDQLVDLLKKLDVIIERELFRNNGGR